MADTALELQAEMDQARELAERYRFEFLDLRSQTMDSDLLRSIPLDLMLRYEFLPVEAQDHQLTVAVGDPTDLDRLDELEMKLNRLLLIKVAAPNQGRLLGAVDCFARGRTWASS